MPQLIPYYYINQITFTLIIFLILLYFISKYILPRQFRVFFIRLYIKYLTI